MLQSFKHRFCLIYYFLLMLNVVTKFERCLYIRNSHLNKICHFTIVYVILNCSNFKWHPEARQNVKIFNVLGVLIQQNQSKNLNAKQFKIRTQLCFLGRMLKQLSLKSSGLYISVFQDSPDKEA